ncbi:DNA-binding protein (plasmid) [Burkholderia thailandensis]|uniref:DNA-binding protein n=1 Tax=Burkholderia thailandensis TaxID=57975 RepID=UPI00192D4770|nr:DNA-binding protein [Burkholderia thailandensis]MBS2132189.1 DNA-binding protein [Burkholderia thailandensis]QRA15285.1 DNA-binding protein [Burkholderia thailandensis]
MARAGLTRSAVKRARDTLVAQGQHPSIDAIRIALGNTGSKTTIHRYLKELEEKEGTSLTRAASLSDTIQDLVARLAARLHEEAQALVDQQATASATQRQQAQTEMAKLTTELATRQAQFTATAAALSSEQDAHTETRLALHQRDLDVERLTQQVRDQTARLAEQENFRQSLEEKLVHSRDALEHFRTTAREQREQEARRHEQQVQQLQDQTAIVKQNEITQLNKDNARFVAKAGAAARQLRDAQTQTERQQTALTQALADGARGEAERAALCTTLGTQTEELARVRETLAALTAERTQLAAQLEAQQLLLGDYRQRLGLEAAPTANRQILRKIRLPHREAGHALAALRSPGQDPLHKVSIVPRGRAFGVTLSLPERDRHSFSKQEPEGRLATMFGGRVAEELIYGQCEITTGASDDIRQATLLARRMVTEFGFSELIGPVNCVQALNTDAAGAVGISNGTGRIIDNEVRRIIGQAETNARRILATETDQLHIIARALLDRETLTGDDVDMLLSQANPARKNVGAIGQPWAVEGLAGVTENAPHLAGDY